MIAGEVFKHRCLLPYLGLDEDLPRPFLGGLACFDLGSVAFSLNVMSVERQHNAHGQMIPSRDQNRRPGIQQFQKDRLRVGSARIVDDHDAQVLYGPRHLGQVGPLYHELPVGDGEAGSWSREFEGLADHCSSVQSLAGRMRPMGSTDSFLTSAITRVPTAGEYIRDRSFDASWCIRKETWEGRFPDSLEML